MDSFESDEWIIGTIIKCDDDIVHGLSDSPPRITLSLGKPDVTKENNLTPVTTPNVKQQDALNTCSKIRN